jgi:heat shock protein HslJ
MTAKLIFGIGVLLSIPFQACKTGSKNTSSSLPAADNSMVSVDWPGTYYGILPCADCEGIETVLTLNKDLTYILKKKYGGKDDASVHETKGSFTWNKEGSKVTLKGENPGQYLVGENQLFQLDQNGNRITGSLADKYRLARQVPAITEKYWKLTELFGKKLEPDQSFVKEPHMILRAEGNNVKGHGSCNAFSGTYELQPNDRITFSKMAGTMMACPNMEVENNFHKVLGTADSYILKGDTLLLIRARMAPLARFEAVYFR